MTGIDADRLVREREERLSRYLSWATDAELEKLDGLLRKGDDDARAQAAHIAGRVARRAAVDGPVKRRVRLALARATRHRQRRQVTRAEAHVVSPTQDEGVRAEAVGDGDDLAEVIDLDTARQQRPAAVQAWIDRSGSSESSPRAWVSQASRRNWAATRGIDDVEW